VVSTIANCLLGFVHGCVASKDTDNYQKVDPLPPISLPDYTDSIMSTVLIVHSTVPHSTTKSTSESVTMTIRPSPIDVRRLKSRYLRLQPTAKTDWPKHKVTKYVRLALVKKDDLMQRDENLNEVTKLTLRGDVDRILKRKEPLYDLRDIFHYENKPFPRLIVIMGGPGKYLE